jgi:hypothetical protein
MTSCSLSLISQFARDAPTVAELQSCLERDEATLLDELLFAFQDAAEDAVELNRALSDVVAGIDRSWPAHARGARDTSVEDEHVEALQVAAERLAFRIENRVQLRAELARRFSAVLVPSDVVRHVMAPALTDGGPPVDDDVCDALDRMMAQRAEAMTLLPCATAELDALRTTLLNRAVARIRAAILARFVLLARGDGSLDAELVQFRSECSCQLRFLRRHAAASAAAAAAFDELRQTYSEVMATVYHYHYFTYRSDLAKLQTLTGVASAADVLAAPQRRTSSGASTGDKRDIHEADVRRLMFSLTTPIELAKATVSGSASEYLRAWMPGIAAAAPSGAAGSARTLTRVELLSSLSAVADASPHMRYVAYHEMRTRGSQLRFEYAWWTFCDILFDSVLRELHLQLELFGALLDDVFADVWPFVETWLCDQMVANSFDCVELLLVYACNVRSFSKLQIAALVHPAHVAFFERIQTHVVHRYTEVMARHVASLSEFVPTSDVPLDAAPHFISQRYCDLLGSVFHVLARCDDVWGAVAARAAHEAPGERASFVASSAPSFVSHAVITAPIAQLRLQFHRAMVRCADQFGADVLRSTAFLANQLGHIVSSFQSHRYVGVTMALQEAGSLEQQLIEKLQLAAEFLVAQFLPSLTRVNERNSAGDTAALATAFVHEWRRGQALAPVQGLVLTLFVDFGAAQALLRRLAERICAQHAQLIERVPALAVSSVEVHQVVSGMQLAKK